MDLRALRVVVAIADQGSVKRAGTALHQSPSTVSHALIGLERELGIALFHRLPHGMALTDAGDVFLVAARRTLHEADIALAAIDEVRGLVTGQLVVAAVRAYTVTLADLLGSFAARHPGVLLRVLPPETQSEVGDLVTSGACEVGFIRQGHTPAGLESMVIGTERTVAVLPANHPLSERGVITVAELAGERMVAPLASSAMRPLFDETFHRHGVQAQVAAEAAMNEMVLELVRAGVGCTIATSSSVASVVGRGVAVLDLADQRESEMLLVTRAGAPLTPAARALRELASTHA